MQQILEKRSYDSRLFDIVCTGILNANETVQSVTSASSDEGDLVFGPGVPNGAPVVYPDGTSAGAGQVVQIPISGGKPTAGQQSKLYTVRVRFVTSAGYQREATVQLRVTDKPSN